MMPIKFPKLPSVLRKQGPEVAFVLLAFTGLLFWILSAATGRFNAMMDGLGVEILGAIITALGVLGLERIYARPDPQLESLMEEVRQQSAKIDALQTQLQTALSQLSPAIKPPDVPPANEAPNSEAADASL